MRTNRERTNRETSRERGIVGLVLLAIIVIVIAAAAFFFVARKQDAKAGNDTDSVQNYSSRG